MSKAWTAGLTILVAATVATAAKDIPIADFEGTDYEAWKATGEAFGKAPARGTIGRQQRVSGFQGKGLVNTYLPNDLPRGTLTSPAFKIERQYITFLIGGGAHLEDLEVHEDENEAQPHREKNDPVRLFDAGGWGVRRKQLEGGKHTW